MRPVDEIGVLNDINRFKQVIYRREYRITAYDITGWGKCY